MANKKEGKTTNHFFGKLLFILIMIAMAIVYILLIFNKIFIKVSHLGYWLLYIIFGLLLLSLIIFLRPLFLSIIRIIKKRGEIRKKEKIRRVLKKKRIKTEMLRLKKELKRRRLLEKEKRREEKKKRKEEIKRKKLLEKEEKKFKEKKPSIFSKLFKRKKQKRELKPEVSTQKRIEKKISLKEVKTEGKKFGRIFYFILFLLSIIIFFIAYFYRHMLIMAITLILMFLSLFVYRRLKTKKPKRIEKKEIKEEKPGFFSKLFKKKIKEEKPKKEKIPLVRELSKSLKIELGRYETDIDILYKIIEKTGRIKISAISKYFGIDKRKAEEWVTILQEHSLAEIHYPAVGEPELRKKISQ